MVNTLGWSWKKNCRDKKTSIFFFAFSGLSGKFGKQSLRFRGTKTFFFGITGFWYQNENPSSYDDGGTLKQDYYNSFESDVVELWNLFISGKFCDKYARAVVIELVWWTNGTRAAVLQSRFACTSSL